MARWLGLWLPVMAFMAAVFVLSGQDTGDVDVPVWDKALHVVAYATFGGLCLRACHGGTGPMRGRPTVAALLLAVGYGALDEWHQAWVPGRDASVEDWLADVVGVGIAAALWRHRFGRPRR